MLLFPLTNFQIRKYHQNKPKSNGVYSRNNLVFIVEHFPKEIRQFIKIIITNIYRIHAHKFNNV